MLVLEGSYKVRNEVVREGFQLELERRREKGGKEGNGKARWGEEKKEEEGDGGGEAELEGTLTAGASN